MALSLAFRARFCIHRAAHCVVTRSAAALSAHRTCVAPRSFLHTRALDAHLSSPSLHGGRGGANAMRAQVNRHQSTRWLSSSPAPASVSPSPQPSWRWSVRQRAAVNETLSHMYTHAHTASRAYALHAIPPSLWPSVVAKFRRRILAAPEEFFADSSTAAAWLEDLLREGVPAHTPAREPPAVKAALDMIAGVARAHFSEALTSSAVLRRVADLRSPHAWYPAARAMRRRVHFHAGPTNSGKTHRALAALFDSHSGVYAGPLRLLALEVYEGCNTRGLPMSLMTGQERKLMPFATHTSATMEMVDTETRVDVAVIDEIQMIADAQRGAAWTRALLGVPAAEVHVCGDPAALPVVEALTTLCGDELHVHNYSRLTTLTPLRESLDNDYSRIQEGDCIVAFSRKDIYAIRRVVERKTAHKCCVVYGSLPPETRSQQARLFNDPGSGFRVLVASDAIGMGLNLNIRRVVFHTMDKFDGDSVGPVVPPQVKQIAGRAGRARSMYPEGFVTTLSDDDLPYLHTCLATSTAPITRAGLFPNAEQLIAFAAHLPADTPLATLIDNFVSASQLDGPYFMCRADDMKTIATLCQPFPLTIAQRCALCVAPANLKNLEVRAYFLRYLEEYAAGRPVRLDLQLPFHEASYLIRNLESLEAKIQALDVYMWLAHRLGILWFPDLSDAVAKRNSAALLLETALTAMSEETKADWERTVQQKRRRMRQHRTRPQMSVDRP